MILTNKFDLATFTHSDTADRLKIDNTQLTDEQLENLERLHSLLVNIQSRLSTKYQKPIQIKINSGFRCEALNKAIGGVATSQHCKGEAADTVAIGIAVVDYFRLVKSLVKDKVLVCDQCINENESWLHISIKKENNRNQFLKMAVVNGKKQYIPA